MNGLYSSDLLRARETASYIAAETGCPINFDLRFREIDGGHCSGLRISEMKEQFPSWWEEKRKEIIVGSQKHCFIQSRNASGFFAVCYQVRVIGQCQELGNIPDGINIHSLDTDRITY